jgi:hypothetical protein
MSIEAMTIVLNHSKAVGTPKVVMLGIANHYGADAASGAYPSQKRLARYANVSVRSVREAVSKLVDLGELTVELHEGMAVDWNRTNRYFITLTCPEDCDRTMNHGSAEAQRNSAEAQRTPSGSVAQSERKPASAEPLSNREITIGDEKGKRLEEDWWPSEDAWAEMSRKFPQLDLTLVTEEFKDYWLSLPGSRAKKLDWNRTWQGRVREQAGRAHRIAPKKPSVSIWDMDPLND